MLPQDEKRTQQRVAAFWNEVRTAYQEAEAIVFGRQATRDVGMPPWEKMPYGTSSFLTFVYHKVCRLVSMMTVAAPTDISLQAKIDDEILDAMNYLAMLRAYRKLIEVIPMAPDDDLYDPEEAIR
uniref:Uncharacterized protein n=1 Tax=viral metagenome TaxID=1070528 RepID=A0A6M3J3L4_9ZZZZ